ncbi:unnamed protein product [Rotaria magnacalcarata]|uniref:Uncharacterized protein n=1 Tax=Rotaria magnacalcarata TaxID=392030 RepID=A0A819HQM0_9BILA|nr:unnamed protein product [Rotaria magnacalcarata]CAF2097164.1 unnamed protein product [Rotaria magnacalcarata]CAF3902001.1 unnamed protein product [Rotaria magnacalcarata]CAF4155539.1 unnamed protein product [Rotaria magnacalcarata]
MTVIISFISFLILLIATCSYSLPIEQQHAGSTTGYNISPGTKEVLHEDEINIQLVSDEKTTEIPNIDTQESLDTTRSDEPSNPDQFEYPEDISLPSSTADDDMFTSSPIISVSETISSNNTNDESSLYDSLFTTIQANTQFELGLINTHSSQSQEEISTILADEFFRNDNQTEMTTNIESLFAEPKSSIVEGLSVGRLESEPSPSAESASEVSITTESKTSKVSSSTETESHVSEVSLSSSVDIFNESDGLVRDDQLAEKPARIDYDKIIQSSEEIEEIATFDSTELGKITVITISISNKNITYKVDEYTSKHSTEHSLD